MTLLRAAAALVIGVLGAGAAMAPAATADEASNVRIAIAVPLVVPAETTGLISADELAQYTSPLGVLTRQLDAVFGRQVAIGIDPKILASIRLLGSSAPPSAVDWLNRLRSAPNETFALAYDDADLTLASQAGAAIIPGPQSFDFAIDPGLFAPASTETPTPNPTPAPGEIVPQPLPTTDDLLDWPFTLSGVAWPRDDSAVASDIGVLAASGYSTTILSSTNVAREGTAGSSVAIGDETTLVSDSAVSTALRAAARAVSDDEWSAAMGTLNAAISAAGRVQPAGQATVFATFDREVPFTGGRLAQTLDALAADPSLTDVPVATVLATAASKATVIDEPQAADRVTAVRAAFDAERAEQQFASVAKDPLEVTAPRRLALLAVLANQWQTNLEAWPPVAADYLTSSTTLLSSVEVVASSGFNLLADRATLPVVVSNALDQPVTVYITVRPDTGLLAVGSSRVKLVIEPNAQGKGQVPVQAISNGRVGLTVTLTSSSGVPIGTPTRTTINVQAGWETPVVVVLAVLVVLMFGFGIVRTVLRRRKSARD